MKKCTKCGIEKLFSDFNKSKRNKNGLRSSCRECDNSYNARWRSENKEHSANHHLIKRYGISLDEKKSLLRLQGWKCAICHAPITERGHLDHNHYTGVVRGVLCYPCNKALGAFKDSPKIVKNAYQYLIEKGYYGP